MFSKLFTSVISSGSGFFFTIFFEYVSVEIPFWSSSQHQFFNELFSIEQPVKPDLIWYFSYLFRVHLFPLDGFHASKIGPGFFAILILPFALIGFIKECKKKQLYRISALIIVPALFYTFWFFIGSSQRFRYILPIYPLIVLYVFYYYMKFTEANKVRNTVAIILPASLVLVFQAAVYAAYSAGPVRYVFSGEESRRDYIENNIPWVSGVFWINENLPDNAYVLSDLRQYRYYSNRNIFIGQPLLQDIIKIRPDSTVEEFVGSIKKNGITHLLTRPSLSSDFKPKGKKMSSYEDHMVNLYNQKCLVEEGIVPVKDFGSRTLKGLNKMEFNQTIGVYTLSKECFLFDI